MTCRRTMLMLLVAAIPLAGCSPDWYERDADRQITKILDKRKEETLGYKPQAEAKMNTTPQPTTRAYEKVPITAIPQKSIIPLQALKEGPVNEPLGPKVPDPADNNFDLVPAYYTAFSVSIDRMGPPAPGSLSVNLDLLSSIEYGVAHARPYMDRMEDLYLTTLAVTLERHNFDPQFNAATSFQFAGNQGGRFLFDPTNPAAQAPYQSALAVVNSVGVKQNLPYGGSVAAQQLYTLTHALNETTQDGDDAHTVLSATIPLLKGAGLVNLEDLINSERQLVYSVRNFETFRRSFAVNVASQYFQLITQQQGIRNRRQSYQTLLVLDERSTAMFAAGRMGFLEVQRARQNLLQAENDLINAINVYQTSLDSYKITLGMPVEADLEIVPVELTVDIPELDNSVAANTALKYRLDLQTAKDQVDDARRGVENAKNGLLPDVRLNAQGVAGNFANQNAWNSYNSDSWVYSTGVTINWPLDQLAERNAYRQSLIGLERSFRSYVQAREQVISDVRQISRSIRLALVTVEIQKRSVELNQRRLDLASEKLTQGTGQVLDFTDAQSALLNAQDSYDRARATLQTQVLQYLRDTGTLRLSPGAGQLSRAMDRSGVMQRDSAWFGKIERKLRDVER